MPRPSRTLASKVLAQPTQAGLVAAATRHSGSPSVIQRSRQVKSEGWQKSAWEWFDTIGEYRYSVNWVGNVLSKATLNVEYNGKPATNQHALDAMASLYGGPEGQSEMLRLAGIHFTVAGEAYIVGESGGAGADDEWFMVASTEITQNGSAWKMTDHDFVDPLVIRLWRPHPRKYAQSDSPSRAILNILAEIDGLTKHVAAQIDSRLAGAGILLLPSEISFAGGPSKDSETAAGASTPDADTFLQTLMDTMTTAIGNREDASALVPIVVQAAGEHLDKIRHMGFWSGLDEKSIELRAEAIRRLALGMDMPPEILTGTADLNHWGSWQVEEASIKAHTEPLLSVITGSLSTGYLRPYLEAMEVEDFAGYSITADTSKMRLRPNRSAEALELFDRGELSADALRRENGFEVSDLMTPEERTLWLARKVAGGSTTPELVEAALRMLGVDLQALAPADAPETPRAIEGTEARPIPSLEEHPRRQPPETINDAAVAAADVMVFRALERAGNRLKNRLGANRPDVAAADLYMYVPSLGDDEITELLTDAWSCIDRFGYSISEHSMNTYARMLLSDRRKHDRSVLGDYLTVRATMEQVA